MKIYIILLLLVLLSACKDQVIKGKEINITTHKLTVPDSIITPQSKTISDSIMILVDTMLLEKKQALMKFGNPLIEETILLDDLYGEFRGSINNKYSEVESQSRAIYIEEVTWEKDSANYITIWYEIKEIGKTPKASLIWNKLLEF